MRTVFLMSLGAAALLALPLDADRPAVHASAAGRLPALAFSVRQTAPALVDVWAPLRFLLGRWDTTNSGQPGAGTGQREYTLVLRDHYIEVRNTSTYPPQPQNPKGESHQDAGFISVDTARKMFVFRQFHSEGFVNTYTAPTEPGASVVFTSEGIENIPTGWRARETYRRVSDDEFVEVFELAEPGKPFSVYSQARLTRRR